MKVLFLSSLWPTAQCPQYVVFLTQLAQALNNNNVEISVGVITGDPQKDYISDLVKVHIINNNNYENELNHLISSEKYDIVDMHFMFNFKLVKFLYSLCKKYSVVLVRHIHGVNVFRDYYEKYPLYGKWMAIKKKLLYKKCDAIIGVSNKVCDIYKRGMKADNAYTVYNGVDINKFHPLENKPQNEKLEIVCIANLIKIKGQDYLIRGLKLLKDDGYENFHLSLYGQGVEENNLRSLVDELGLNDYVEFKGYVEYDKVAEHLKYSDIFIMPSYFEALGCVYLEAMASKVCTVGCENQGIAEIIEHGKNGLLVKEQDEKSIYEALKTLIDNPQKRKEMSEEGYKTIQEFTWDKSAKEMIKIYNELLCKKQANRRKL